MPDRRALVIGSWSSGATRPTPQRINGLVSKWKRILEDERYGFRSLDDPTNAPKPLVRPRRRDLVGLFEDAVDVGPETELLIHFVGHSVARGDDDLDLNLGEGKDGESSYMPLSELLREAREKRIGKVFFVLDACHAGRAVTAFSTLATRSFAMLSTGTGYAFDADFSDAFLASLERPLRKRDQRVDRGRQGVTYRRVFEDAKGSVLRGSAHGQVPRSCGDLGDEVLLPVPTVVPEGYAPFASIRTIYGRLHVTMEELRARERPRAELIDALRTHPAFVLQRPAAGDTRSVSAERVADYLDFLRAVRWLVEPAGILALTEEGRAACDKDTYNLNLIAAIERHVLPPEMPLERLDTVVRDLLTDMILPSPVRIRERASMTMDVDVDLNSAMRIALAVLPTTGRFMKGSADAIFPADPGTGS